MDAAEEADARLAHHHLRSGAPRAARNDAPPGRAGGAKARGFDTVGHCRQGHLALCRGAHRLEHGRACVEDDAFSWINAQWGEQSDGALLAMLELRIERGLMLEGRLQRRHEKRAAMGAFEITALGRLLEIAAEGGSRSADLLCEFEDRSRTIEAHALEDHGAALSRDDVNPL